MKKFLLSFLLTLAVSSVFAAVNFPYDVYQDFKNGDTFEEVLGGWSVTAPAGQKPSSTISQYFTDYSDEYPFSILGLTDGTVILATPSAFKDGSTSDSWLISPEFEITTDEAVLSYGVFVVGTTTSQKSTFAAYISEGGTNPEDFKLLQEGTIAGGDYGSNAVEKRAQISGMKGKKVRIALVNKGNSVGFLSYYNIAVGSWAFTVDNAASFNTIYYTAAPTIEGSVKMSTPETVIGQKIELYNEAGELIQSTETSKRTRLSQMTSVKFTLSGFKVSKDSEKYSIHITPLYEGAKTLVITGVLQKVDKKYDFTSVIEEATGAWCGWCVFGAACLNYAHDHYNGKNGSENIILIAAHGGDVMQTDVNNYFSSFSQANNITGYPTMILNRNSNASPVGFTNFSSLLGLKSFADAKLKRVTQMNNKDLVAEFDVKTSYSTDANRLTASIIVVEDGVKGNNSDYNQSNYANQFSWSSLKSQYGYTNEWQSYLEPYYNGTASISYKDMTYDHVARGVYPSYRGKLLPEKMVADEAKTAWIDFEMPTNVQNPQNTYVVLLITNEGTGEIYAADEMPYSEFIPNAGISDTNVANGAVKTAYNNGILTVNTPAAAEVMVYGIDGSVIMNTMVAAGENNLAIESNGVVIVKVTTADATETFKLLAR